MPLDTAYIERCNGHWEAWTYSAGCRVYIGQDNSREILAARLSRRGYCVIYI